MQLSFTVLDEQFTIHQFSSTSAVPLQVLQGDFFSITKTDDELSIVYPSSISLSSTKTEPGWNCLKVIGPLDFSLTGVLAEISTTLAEQEISIFAISTFDTDYILIKSADLPAALFALQAKGYTVE